MDIVVNKLDGGLPARFAQHLYTVAGNFLQHFTDGELRATVELKNVHQFVADHPEAELVLNELVPDLAAKVQAYKLERATVFAADRQKVKAGADQSAIDKIVAARLEAALEQYQAIIAKKIAEGVDAAIAARSQTANVGTAAPVVQPPAGDKA